MIAGLLRKRGRELVYSCDVTPTREIAAMLLRNSFVLFTISSLVLLAVSSYRNNRPGQTIGAPHSFSKYEAMQNSRAGKLNC